MYQTLANVAICLIHQANDLPDCQIKRLEKDFSLSTGYWEWPVQTTRSVARRVTPWGRGIIKKAASANA
jgi:four helix bundle suffix protein